MVMVPLARMLFFILRSVFLNNEETDVLSFLLQTAFLIFIKYEVLIVKS